MGSGSLRQAIKDANQPANRKRGKRKNGVATSSRFVGLLLLTLHAARVEQPRTEDTGAVASRTLRNLRSSIKLSAINFLP